MLAVGSIELFGHLLALTALARADTKAAEVGKEATSRVVDGIVIVYYSKVL